MQAESDTNRAGAPAEGSTVTVVIVNWNSGELLRVCLESIRRTAGGLQVKVVVVDNASRDGSADLVAREFPEVLLIQSGKNLGFGKGNNLAQPHVLPGYVLFLNPDTTLREKSLQGMVEFLETHSDVGAVGCRMVFPDGEVADQNLQWFPSPLTEFVRHTFLTYGVVRRLEGVLPWKDPLKSDYVSKLYGGCVMVRTSVLAGVGWFDERFFMYAEDVDLSRRIREAGWRLYYLSEAEIMHAAGGATKGVGSGFSTLMACESMAQLIEKYQGAPAAFLYRVGIVGASIIRLCFLIPLLLLSRVVSAARGSSHGDSAKRCALRIKWALRLRAAYIPE